MNAWHLWLKLNLVLNLNCIEMIENIETATCTVHKIILFLIKVWDWVSDWDCQTECDCVCECEFERGWKSVKRQNCNFKNKMLELRLDLINNY